MDWVGMYGYTYSLHPGVIASDLWRDIGVLYPLMKVLFFPVNLICLKTAWEGAQTTLYTVLEDESKLVKAFAKAFSIQDSVAREVLEKTVHDVFPQLARHFYPVPGAVDFIAWAKNHYTLILATNPIWLPPAVELRVKWAGLELSDFFSFTHSGRMSSCKPRLEYYEELLAQENLKPSQCLLIGNDPKNDLPASRGGISVFLLAKRDGANVGHCKPLLVGPGAAPSWLGNFVGLRALLETFCQKPDQPEKSPS